MKPVIKIGVVSDVVCPWCYIGKTRLEKAISKVSDKYHFEIEYFPFELNPTIPSSGLNQKQYLSDKFGGEQRYHQITEHTTAVAAGEGLEFNFDKQQISPNTRNAHRLIQVAREEGNQLQVVEGFFKAYFTDGVDLSNVENVIAVAETAGLDRAKAEKILHSDAGIAEVEMTERELQQLGITGVPFYIIQNKFGISGAQAPETFINAFEEAISTVQPVINDNGDVCDVDEKNC